MARVLTGTSVGVGRVPCAGLTQRRAGIVRTVRTRVRLVLFDLGGVLMGFRGVAAMRELAGGMAEAELWRRWLTCRWVRAFESGRCSEGEFASGMVEDWGLAVSPEEFLAGFAEWAEGPLPGAEALVAEVRAVLPVGCLSNTNPLHWHRRPSAWPLVELFDHRFLSFELGLVKPDRAIFEHVAAAVPVPAGEVLFLDDNAANVEAAQAAGFGADRVSGVADARRALVAAAVLPQGDRAG